MTAIVPFNSDSALPAYLMSGDVDLDVNKEVVRTAAFPVMSIKGMKFTMVQDGVRRVLTKPDDPDEVAQSIGVVMLRANLKAKTFYAAKYSEGDSDGARPTCYSYDGERPSPNAQEPQANKCAICPHNQWGARMGDNGEAKGKACSDNARIAISAPDNMNPTLLRVPPASLKGLKEMLKIVASRKVPYPAVVVKIGFDREAPSPKLTFKGVGLLNEAEYNTVKALYDDEVVRAIVGADDVGHDVPAIENKPTVDTDELDAAIAARRATSKAKAEAGAPPVKPKADPKPTVTDDELDDLMGTTKKAAPAEEKPAPKAAKAETPAPKSSGGMLTDLDDLLGTLDD